VTHWQKVVINLSIFFSLGVHIKEIKIPKETVLPMMISDTKACSIIHGLH
jgi:hypothetical protein